MLGDLLTKRPGAKRVDQFMSKQLQQKVDGMTLDAKIADSFNKMNERLNKRLNKLNNVEWIPDLD